MRRKGILVLAVLATMGALLHGCGPARNPVVESTKTRASPSPEARADVPILVSADNAFAFDLFRAIRSEGENFVCSPYSLSVVLSMTMAGAIISLDESGTEAAAASAVGVAAGIEELDASISFDRPFLCLIRDTTTGSILFLGQVLDPSSEGG